MSVAMPTSLRLPLREQMLLQKMGSEVKHCLWLGLTAEEPMMDEMDWQTCGMTAYVEGV